MKLRIPLGTLVQCPECNQTCNSGRGLATHLRILHRMSRKDAMEIIQRVASLNPESVAADKVRRAEKVQRQRVLRKGQVPRKVRSDKGSVKGPRSSTVPHPAHATIHFHYCPACGAALQEMEGMINAGLRVQRNGQ